jgi:type III secretion protein J
MATVVTPSLLVACAVPVASDLDDSEANRIVVALDRASLEATKEADPNAEGKWRVDITRDDVARALSVMKDDELPRREPPGVLDAVGKGSLVPSEAAEQAQLLAGLAGDLERSLDGIEGVLAARVHLSIPPASASREPVASHATASALIEYRGATPPIGADAIQRLVAGAASGLLPADVSVVMVPRTAPPVYGGDGDIAHLGPIAVTRASMRILQAALVALVSLVATLAALTILLYSRLSRARAALARDPPLAHP